MGQLPFHNYQPPPISSQMMATQGSIFLLFLFAALAIFDAPTLAQEHVPKCGKLRVRKEWRKLEQSEKAQWIGAVKV